MTDLMINFITVFFGEFLTVIKFVNSNHIAATAATNTTTKPTKRANIEI